MGALTWTDDAAQKAGMVSSIVLDEGQVPTEHDQNRGLCRPLSRATDIPVQLEVGRPTAESLAWFRGTQLLTPINYSAHPDFVTWRWLNMVLQDNQVNFVTARLWPPPTASVPEELRFRRRRDRKSKGNTGASAALASHIRAFEVLPPETASPGFLTHDPGVFHWRAISVAKNVSSGPAARGDGSGLTKAELLEKRKLISGYHDKGESPVDPWAGDDDPADVLGDPDKSAFNPETPRTFARGRGRYKTDEEDFQEREAWEKLRANFEAILRAGKGWSPLDPPGDTRVLSNGVKINLSNSVVKKIEYEVEMHRKNFDTRRDLATELGVVYETERKRELREINMKKECPNTPFTAKQMKDFNERGGNVTYVHVTLSGRGWWHKLDMDRHATYREAIEEVRWRAQDEALKKAGVPSRSTDRRTPESDPALAHAFKEVVVRFNESFNPENIYILDLRSPTLIAIAEDEWGKVNQSCAISVTE
ncbi:MAG: hypothetical protein JWO71_1311 [Candidatus Acidoferrum typicum]|nr:hypothetical protein [Candidatus Acidoferrum typicum]